MWECLLGKEGLKSTGFRKKVWKSAGGVIMNGERCLLGECLGIPEQKVLSALGESVQ